MGKIWSCRVRASALTTVAGLALAASATPAWAQHVGPPHTKPGATPDATRQVVAAGPATAGVAANAGDIVVTARRREESIQRVPVAVTAIGAEELRTKSIRTTYDLAANTPGLVVRGAGASRNQPEYFIRGQGASFGTPPGVILYFAESSLGPVGSSSFFDLQSVQVLKGPQGTLFGRSTTGGAILFTPRKPGKEFGGFVEVEAGNLAYRQVTAAVDLPLISDKVGFRVAFKSEQRDGYTTSLSTGQKQDERNRQSYRLSLMLKPFDGLQIYTLFQEDRIDEAPGSNVFINYDRNTTSLLNTSPGGRGLLTVQGLCGALNPGNPAGAASCISTRVARLDALRNGYAAEFARIQAGGDSAKRFTQTGISGPPDRLRSKTAFIVNNTSLHIGDAAFLGDVTVKNIFATTKTFYNTGIRSIGGTPFENGRNYTGVDFTNGQYVPTIYGRANWGDNFTEEFQVAGHIPNTLDWIVGYYQARSKTDISSSPFFSSFNNAFTNPLDRNAPIGGYTINSRRLELGYFGQGTLDLSRIVDGLHFTGGYRRTKSESSSGTRPTVFVADPLGGSFVPGAVPTAAPYVFQQSADSYSLTLDWQVNRNLMVYLAHRRGFKPGGVNNIALANPGVPGLTVQFGPEVVKDAEFGTKAKWSIGSVQGRTNFAAYYQDYKGLQRTQQLASPNPPFATFTQTNNIGAAKIKGIELENLIQLTNRLTLTVNYGYIDAKYTNYPGTTKDINGVFHNNIDTPYTGTAKHQLTLDARYKLPLAREIGDVFAGVQFYAQSGVWLDDSALNNPNIREGYQPGYQNVNLRLDWNNLAGLPVDASFFVRNVTNGTRLSAVANFLTAIGVINGIYDEPRTYGMSVRVRFGANGR
jgi:iron complex outermembrane receptor protein